MTGVTAGTRLTGGTITTSGTIAVDVGTGANQIVQFDASSKLPAVDGSQLINVTASDSSKLPLAGGTMTGAIDMGAQNIKNANVIGAIGDISTNSNTTATHTNNYNSPNIYLNANYWNGSTNKVDSWSVQNILGTGANPTSTLYFNHTGSTGATQYGFLNGKVGIGTGSPATILDILGSSTANITLKTTSSSSSYFNLENAGGAGYIGMESGGGGLFGTESVPYGFTLSAPAGTPKRPMQFITSNMVRMFLDINGNVGIGTTSPV